MKMDELMGNPFSVKISKIINETSRAKTLLFPVHHQINFRPGQFVMVWIPDVDEIPMSISSWNTSEMGITVLTIGAATKALFSMERDDWIGIRGPFGTSFKLDSKQALIVGGGVGIAPLKPLVYALLEKGAKVTLLNAAKSKNELIYLEEFKNLTHSNFKTEVATDDGSLGFKGLATDVVKNLLDDFKFDTLYTCGPELMMAKLHELAEKRKIQFQASLERFMKCGCGICGTCALDPSGQLVCKDGPVLSGEQLTRLSDFGKYHRDAVGMKKEC